MENEGLKQELIEAVGQDAANELIEDAKAIGSDEAEYIQKFLDNLKEEQEEASDQAEAEKEHQEQITQAEAEAAEMGFSVVPCKYMKKTYAEGMPWSEEHATSELVDRGWCVCFQDDKRKNFCGVDITWQVSLQHVVKAWNDREGALERACILARDAKKKATSRITQPVYVKVQVINPSAVNGSAKPKTVQRVPTERQMKALACYMEACKERGMEHEEGKPVTCESHAIACLLDDLADALQI